MARVKIQINDLSFDCIKQNAWIVDIWNGDVYVNTVNVDNEVDLFSWAQGFSTAFGQQ